MKQAIVLWACAVALLSLPVLSFAQESSEPPVQEGTVVADVNLSDATIVRNDGTTVKVSSVQQASDRSALPPNIESIMREQMLRDERFQGFTEEEKEETFRSILEAMRNAEQVDPIGDRPCSESLIQNASEDTRIPYLALSGYPLHELGDDAVSTLSACVRNTDVSVAKDVSLTLTLTDANGKEIETVTDTGALVNMAFATAHEFSFENRNDALILTATLTKDGEVLETRAETYDCEDYGFCPPPFVAGNTMTMAILAVGVLLIIALILILICYKDKVMPRFGSRGGSETGLGIVLLVFVAGASLLLSFPETSCAQVGGSFNSSGTYTSGDCTGSYWAVAVLDINFGYCISVDTLTCPCPTGQEGSIVTVTSGNCGLNSTVTTTDTCTDVSTSASCGSANGVTVSSVPTTDLCSAGTSSAVAENATSYDWTCSGSNGGADAFCSALKTQTLKVCANDCTSGARYDTLSSFSNVPVTLFACLGTGECSGNDTPVSGDWAADDTPGNAVDISITSGTSTYVTKNPALSGIASEDITVTYDGKSADAQALLNGCIPVSCTAEEKAEHCSSESFTIDNGCGGTTECEGTRNCNFNWREVAPGE